MKKFRYFFSTIGIIAPSLLITSCSANSIKIDQKLKNEYVFWYNNLTKQDWNRDNNGKVINYHSESETQSITLYANNHGNFWNEYLHQQKEPINKNVIFTSINKNEKLEIRGLDYKYIDTALEKAIAPYDFITFHGVEYMEVEFYEQLKNFIKFENGKYDYKECVGKTITSYGFISSTTDKNWATSFFGYKPPWETEIEELNPLKSNILFEINIKKNYKGAAYLADFCFNGIKNRESQILIKRNSIYKINSVRKEKNYNIFNVDLI